MHSPRTSRRRSRGRSSPRGPGDAQAAEVVDRLAPELRSFLAAMAELSQRERVLCALPFALEVR